MYIGIPLKPSGDSSRRPGASGVNLSTLQPKGCEPTSGLRTGLGVIERVNSRERSHVAK